MKATIKIEQAQRGMSSPRIERNRHRAPVWGRERHGFTLVELMIVVSIIGLLAVIAVPSYVKARETSWKNICVNTLREMEGAKAQAALEYKWGTGDGAPNLGNPYYMNTVSTFLRQGIRPLCPSGVPCYYNPIGELPTCTSTLAGHELN